LLGLSGAVVAVMLSAARATGQPVLLDIGPCGQYQGDGAVAVSADGFTIGGAYLTSSSLSPFIWTPASGVTVLNNDWYGRVGAVSADGASAAGSHSNGGEEFVWRRGGGVDPISTDFQIVVYALSGDGAFVGGSQYYGADGPSSFFLSRSGEMTVIPARQLRGLNRDGTVAVGTSYTGTTDSAYRWTREGGLVFLGAPVGAASSQGMAVSDDGNAAAGYAAYPGGTPTLAFRWTTTGGMQNLGAPAGATNSYGFAISRDGLVVGGHATTASGQHAFIWRADIGAVDLNAYLPFLGTDLTGWTLLEIRGLNGNGRVMVGRGLREVSPGVTRNEAIAVFMDGLCGSADFDHDGAAGTDADVAAFFACLSGDCCATCETSDFDHDGDAGTDADIEAFLRVIVGGRC
jgi:probable HAF family extracellular repeat protein